MRTLHTHTNTSTPELRQSRFNHHHIISCCCREEPLIDLFNHSRCFARFEEVEEGSHDSDCFMWCRRTPEEVCQFDGVREPAETKAIESLYVQAGVFTKAEVGTIRGRNAGIDEGHDPYEDLINLEDVLNTVMWFNEPFRTIVTLLEGLHSSSIYSSKGSVYRIRFVAPGTPHGGPSMSAAASATATSAASATGTTSAAYPLWAMIASLSTKNMFTSTITSGVDPDVEFKDLLQAEADALDSVTTSDSSSVTDTEWLKATPCWDQRRRTLAYSCGSLWQKHDVEWSNSWSDDKDDQMYLQQNSVTDCQLMQKRVQTS